MAIATLSGQGLRLIAILVALLWGCFFAQHSLLRAAKIQQYQAMRDIRLLRFRRQAEPAAVPVIKILPKPPRRSIG